MTSGCQAVLMMRAVMAGYGDVEGDRPASVRGASAPATGTPAAFGFRRFEETPGTAICSGSDPRVRSRARAQRKPLLSLGCREVRVAVCRRTLRASFFQDPPRRHGSRRPFDRRPQHQDRGRPGLAQAGGAQLFPPPGGGVRVGGDGHCGGIARLERAGVDSARRVGVFPVAATFGVAALRRRESNSRSGRMR